jgi:hypothetical protein
MDEGVGMNGKIEVDDHVKWQDGDVERIGFVELISDEGMAYIRDYATYGHKVEVDKLTPTTFNAEEEAAVNALFASYGIEPRENWNDV